MTGLPLQRAEVLDSPRQAILECHDRLPSESRAGLRDVGLSDAGIVHGQWLEDDLARGLRELADRARELEYRELGGVSDVDGISLFREEKPGDALDQVRDVAERPRLRAVAEDGHRLTREGLADQGRHN